MLQINIISSLILFVLIFTLIVLGLIETKIHFLSLKKIPNRIHVNGIRGKSSVVRLIAAGLREGGLKTFAKTTGTTPSIINDKGDDVEIHRLRSASIGEQIKLVRYFSKLKPDVLVIECMAVNPQYQWISEHRIVRSTLGVITNVRRDHLDEMGTTVKDIAKSISNTIPFNGKMITSEKKHFNLFENIGKKRKTEVISSNKEEIKKEYIKNFPYIEHPENIQLALSVCKEMGVSENVALDGMLKTTPDPGALLSWKIKYKNHLNQFVSAFAANDPDSTVKVWELIDDSDKKKCVFLNTRDDRRYRTLQLIDIVYRNIKPDLFIIRGDNLTSITNSYKNSNIKLKAFSMMSTQDEVISYIINLDSYFIMGIGNIVGWGDVFLDKLKKYKYNV
ncbi:MAG: poly-gamma-glutamate synthase PgsB [Candidatus Marinimicrobia bacterium]|nr:poly-gamma-glutamate synthase PgsB [Candidatus Neomarinimicrobiota bacterium]MAW75577.1 poly-gamma-glutamate synthase PgsB [Candidatus Neomarinimicrobiota bacterium]|tara:strand:- start:7718 stop:8890 length:1173 start_codon:yes stop_codon:yes gene_type:complete